ncbi:electron transport complex subunit RsxG [Vibrio alginolyticus]|jgi:electron transport complex protein RnfG|uniref:Ion-translocating oxidoreductase complex subunit G n=7 Tax=Vibrio harveyi group TaxID=717610 RepID=A0A7Y4EYS9_VIBAL|nr:MULTISPECIES: electron transport complex subunit RsxG [Vibrio]MDG2627683.1 electron transport complex subunit RsxG [Vibrio parahaemolyticus]MDW2259238.1 electron transport complex subunit RsxG [Vibrio sp. 1409]AGV17014.1 electron transport complex protein RnfG [Vibrio alginolyticus NBRC 15630 = ATCC 17749]AVF70050.1 electron transport complex subunit RsxG [Vibrio alginolyticus]EAS73869.1 electron transport complex protein RnfG [Vibrio alginolyticus 12G01]
MLTAIRKNGLTLAIFACATTGLVALTQYLTKDQIKVQEQKQLLSVLNQVIPENMHDNALTQACTMVTSPDLGTLRAMPAYLATKNGEPTAIAIESIAPDGYNGEIKVITGIDNQGNILGTRVLNHQETPGLGDKIDLRVTDWILSFTGKQVTENNWNSWKVRKDGGDFDQFTGATITPRAVVKVVRNTVNYVNQSREDILSQPLGCEGEQ